MTNTTGPISGGGGDPSAVVVSGWGTIGASGIGTGALTEDLDRGAIRSSAIDLSDGYHLPGAVTTAALLPHVDISEYLSPRIARRMSTPSRLALVATRIGLENALRRGFEEITGDRIGVFSATSFGPSSYSERILRQIFDDSPSSVSPFLFTESVANAPAAQIALALTATGPNITITQREAGPLLAVQSALRELRNERIDRAVVVCVDEMNPLLHAVLNRFRAVSHLPRPFDRNRDGFLPAEGAVCWILDRPRSGVRPLARILGVIAANDPGAKAHDWGDGDRGLADALRRGVARLGVEPASIDAVVSGANGALRGDRLEGRVLLRSFGGSTAPEGASDLPPILVPKGVTGELGGAVLAAAAGLASDPARFRIRTPGFERPDPLLGILPFQNAVGTAARWGGRSRPAERTVLLSSLAAGGPAAWAAIAFTDDPGLDEPT